MRTSAAYGGTYAVSKGLLEEFGPERVRDTPLSELGFVGIGIGAALGGLRPIVEVMTVNFSLLALDQIVNTAAALRHMSGGQFSVPLVVRMATGAGRQLAAQHSHSLEGWYAHIPGIKVLAPATVEDAYGMLRTALADPDPVIIFEHVQLYNTATDVEHLTPDRHLAGGDSAQRVRCHGDHLRRLPAQGARRGRTSCRWPGIDCEVIDLRVLRPLDTDTIIESVRKTHRAVVVDEAWRTGSLAGEISARIVEEAFFDLDAPIARVCSAEVPIPYAKHLETGGAAAAGQDRRGGAEPVRGQHMIEFTMPALGADMDEGTLNEWLVKPGDTVTRGQIVAVVETTKAAVEIECWHEGTVHELLVPVGANRPGGSAVWRTLPEPGKPQSPHPRPAAATPVPAVVEAAPLPRSHRRRPPTRSRSSHRRPSTPASLGLPGRASGRRVAGRRRRDGDRHRTAGRGHHQRRRACRGRTSRQPHPKPRQPLQHDRRAVDPRSSPPARRRDAQVDRGGDEPVQARDSALLPRRRDPAGHRADLAGRTQRERSITERVLPAVLQLKAVALAAQRFGEFNGFWRDDGFEPAAQVACRRGDLAARRRSGGTGDPRRRRARSSTN